MSEESTAEVPAVNHDQADRDRLAAQGGRLAIGPATGLLFGLVAAALFWLLLSAAYPVFMIPDELAGLPPTAPVEQLQKATAAQQEADVRNHVSVLGAYGVLLGASVAVGEGLARRSLGRILVAGAAPVLPEGTHVARSKSSGIGGAYSAEPAAGQARGWVQAEHRPGRLNPAQSHALLKARHQGLCAFRSSP